MVMSSCSVSKIGVESHPPPVRALHAHVSVHAGQQETMRAAERLANRSRRLALECIKFVY
jgi:hypothetical protein